MKAILEQDYYQSLTEAVNSLKVGAFMTVKAKNQVNTMTIAWGMFGYIWGKPIMQVLVRDSRFTKEFIDQEPEFTVSFPLVGDMKESLKVCGSKSGRTVDKIKVLNLELNDGVATNVPTISGCDLYVECKVVAKQRMTKLEMMDESVIDCYKDNDFHTMYYGEVLSVYKRQ